MQERLKLVDGQLSIGSKPQSGTTIQARVPLSPRMKSAGQTDDLKNEIVQCGAGNGKGFP
jgi:signal transduction histidine kinase